MSTVVITITDHPGVGVLVTCESDPPIPFDGDRVDMENVDHAQVVAIAALMQVGESVGEGFDWKMLVQDS